MKVESKGYAKDVVLKTGAATLRFREWDNDVLEIIVEPLYEGSIIRQEANVLKIGTPFQLGGIEDDRS
ncbi:hypothetical protein [Sinimarinibacterium flocculans]|uniref:hypothetical protein n=1 Tax=Sinimarinibacterium flocculans TaxID=985250 RepID=UPI002493B0B2|nr:hypothetical protein [Sinimarinibacterium flocculans]